MHESNMALHTPFPVHHLLSPPCTLFCFGLTQPREWRGEKDGGRREGWIEGGGSVQERVRVEIRGSEEDDSQRPLTPPCALVFQCIERENRERRGWREYSLCSARAMPPPVISLREMENETERERERECERDGAQPVWVIILIEPCLYRSLRSISLGLLVPSPPSKSTTMSDRHHALHDLAQGIAFHFVLISCDLSCTVT